MSRDVHNDEAGDAYLRSSRGWLEYELKAFSRSLPEKAMVLDAGSGDQRYAALFRQQCYEFPPILRA